MKLQTSFKYLNFGSRKENILDCKLRNNARHLNSHVKSQFFQMYSYVKCAQYIEDTKHYFLKCPCYYFKSTPILFK